ncbi:glycoside hydrolase family 2 protein [Candidatus Solirubrobacter pratensis]|uniref:glycoside hydrolase family 2 protein n=1 Tax=Candidatus Solirubrobacter pratensis TaxID=1298857 RepID=UPI00056BC962|nr:glycoside hydrolase family 2 [Candidatus Solirubrobacter pratensis]
MRARLTFLLPVLALLALLPAQAHAAGKPSAKTLYADGPEGRYLMDGEWLFRLDNADQGVKQRLMRQTSKSGWKAVKVPNVWNLGDPSNASMAGGIGWYRKDFQLPSASAALDWAIRFESVNYRSKVWLNGRPIGENTGAYIPFQFQLSGLKRTGTNRLVIRVDSRRKPTDFPPSGLNTEGVPTGGWWNYGGIQREVYLQKLDTVDYKDVLVRPVLPCANCASDVQMKLTLRNVSSGGKRIKVTGTYGNRSVNLGTKTMGPGAIAAFSDTLRIAKPQLWSPQHPHLYKVHFTVTANGRKVSGYDLHSGIRSIKVSNGHLILNGQALNFRGVGLHEDSKADGFAIDDARREQLLKDAKELGATVIRTHYPLHPYTHELADRLGLLIWSEIPVYSVKTQYLKLKSVRQLAIKELGKNIAANQNHPSVMLWSIGNELSSQPGPVQNAYIKAAAKFAKETDPTRPVGIAVAGYPSSLCQAASYAPLDVLGINDYFGWYPGPNGQIFDRTKLSVYLDAVHACYANKAIVITEFGAEANRDGPVEEKGTWAFQQDWVNFQLNTFATKPWLSGALYWALNEFWVRPGWDGGDPRPQPPVFQKGLITYDGVRKPAWADVQRWFTQTQQLVPATGGT